MSNNSKKTDPEIIRCPIPIKLRLMDVKEPQAIYFKSFTGERWKSVFDLEYDFEKAIHVYTIHDWELYEKSSLILEVEEVEKALALPAFREYIDRPVSGKVEAKEELGTIELQNCDGEVVKLRVIANNKFVDISYDKKRSILQIKLPKRFAICEECGEVYVPVRKDQRFHTKKCKNRFHQRQWRREHPR